MFPRYLLRCCGNIEIIAVEVHVFLHLVCLRTLGRALSAVALAIALEKAARQRTPWNQTDALIHTEWIHLALFLAVDQVTMILHSYKPLPAMFLGSVKGL